MDAKAAASGRGGAAGSGESKPAAAKGEGNVIDLSAAKAAGRPASKRR